MRIYRDNFAQADFSSRTFLTIHHLHRSLQSTDESGASPLDPTDPCEGITGNDVINHADQMFECGEPYTGMPARAFTRSSIIIFTISGGRFSPTPAQTYY